MIRLDLPQPDADALAHSQRLRARIVDEIAAHGGAIPFSRYMELALYAPGLGYYSAGATKFGAAGDFITAPELGPLFARALARGLAPVLAQIEGGEVLELGGGSGAFAADALTALAELGATPTRYALLEPSADLRQRQRQHLQARLPAELFARVAWLDGLPEADWDGVLFANEVLDALPITRFVIGEEELGEEHVALDDAGRFIRVDRPADALLVQTVRGIEQALGRRLPPGYRSEALVQLPWWLQAVAASLRRGLMLLVDYGYPREEFYLPERSDGTLVCYYRHRMLDDPFWMPGLTDITAFVDFSAVAQAGEQAGFELAGFASQAGLLLACGVLDAMPAEPGDPRAMLALAEQTRRLLLPGEMGERFKAIGLQRGVDASGLFAEGDQRHRL